MKTHISATITDLLTKELSYADFASNVFKKEMSVFEKKYSMDWKDFIDKFEKGKLGDERVWFTWYGLATSAKDWDDTKKEIEKTIGTA